MFKFSLYIIFPMGILYLYNQPEFFDKFPSTQTSLIQEIDQKKLYVSFTVSWDNY